MSAQSGHGSNPKSGQPNAPLHKLAGPGIPRTMILGMAAVTAGLGAFWLLQFKVQNRRHDSSNPAEMPTWQFRHAQQMPGFNARMSTPGGTNSVVRNSKEPTQQKTAMPADTQHSGGGAASSGMVQAQAPGNGGRGLESSGSSERGGEDRYGSADPRARDNHTQRQGQDHNQGGNGVVASILTSLQGDPKQANQDSDGHVGEPAATKRFNDRGGIYTKNSDYKDGYRRD